MVFSAFGLAGLLYSLILTRRATKVAVDATHDADAALEIAERNAAAAARLADNQWRIAKHQYSARLNVSPVMYCLNADSTEHSFGLQNNGLTFARDLKASFVAFAKIAGETVFFERKSYDGHIPDIGPNLGNSVAFDVDLAKLTQAVGHRTYPDGGFEYSVVCAVSYTTEFGERRIFFGRGRIRELYIQPETGGIMSVAKGSELLLTEHVADKKRRREN